MEIQRLRGFIVPKMVCVGSPHSVEGCLFQPLTEEGERRRPCFLGRLHVGSVAAGLLSQETVPGALEHLLSKCLPQLFELRFCRWNRGVDSGIVATEQAENRRIDTREES